MRTSAATLAEAMSLPALLGSRMLRVVRPAKPLAAAQRSLAAAASGSFQYETGEASGVKYASRDLPGPTTTLTVVAKAGTRYQPLPGYADALEKFAFKVEAHVYAIIVDSRLTRLHSPRQRDRHFALRESPSYSAVTYLPITREKILSSVQIPSGRSPLLYRITW